MTMTVKEMRKLFEFSQREFADYFGMSVHTVQSWEQNIRNIPEYVFKMMYKIFSSDISDGQKSHIIVGRMLRQLFCAGELTEDNVVENYFLPGYGVCPFYIKSRDLLVDIKNTWYHGGRWFRGNDFKLKREGGCVRFDFDCTKNPADDILLEDWLSKSEDNMCYSDAVKEWTQYDVIRREWLSKHDANYVVFWREDLSDMYDWISAGCPDAKDWKREYSWKQTV